MEKIFNNGIAQAIWDIGDPDTLVVTKCPFTNKPVVTLIQRTKDHEGESTTLCLHCDTPEQDAEDVETLSREE